MSKLKNSYFDKAQKPKTQKKTFKKIVTKLKNLKCDKLKNLNGDKNQKSKCDKTKKKKL